MSQGVFRGKNIQFVRIASSFILPNKILTNQRKGVTLSILNLRFILGGKHCLSVFQYLFSTIDAYKLFVFYFFWLQDSQ